MKILDFMYGLDDQTKSTVDVTAVATTAATFFDYLPDIVSILTGIWMLLRLYEMPTVQTAIQKISAGVQGIRARYKK